MTRGSGGSKGVLDFRSLKNLDLCESVEICVQTRGVRRARPHSSGRGEGHSLFDERGEEKSWMASAKISHRLTAVRAGRETSEVSQTSEVLKISIRVNL